MILPVFYDLGLVLEFTEIEVFRLVGDRLLGKFQQRADVGAEIGVMQEGVFFEADVNKSGVKAGNEFLYFAQIKVSHCKIRVAAFVVQLD